MENDNVLEVNPDQTQLTELYTTRSIDFIRRNREKPFFLYLAHAMPHVPLHAGRKFAGRSRRGLYGDTVEEIDDSAGRILRTVRELGLDDNTLVVYTSDNGPWAPYGMDAGSAGPLRGAKGSHWEGGVRVPMVARWPGKIPAGLITSEVAANLDLLPTFAKLADAQLPSHAIDGKDIFPLMTRAGAPSPHEIFHFYAGSIQYRPEQGRPVNQVQLKAVRSGGWKPHLDEELRARELYDLYTDTGEARNVRDRHTDIAAKLAKSAKTFDASLRQSIRPLGRLED
jgi:arylsulfatase A-like enzyme